MCFSEKNAEIPIFRYCQHFHLYAFAVVSGGALMITLAILFLMLEEQLPFAHNTVPAIGECSHWRHIHTRRTKITPDQRSHQTHKNHTRPTFTPDETQVHTSSMCYWWSFTPETCSHHTYMHIHTRPHIRPALHQAFIHTRPK